MTIKQVWGIVFILLGVFLIVNGFFSLRDMSDLDNLMSGMPIVYSGVSSVDQVLLNAQEQYVDSSQRTIFFGWFKIVVGGLFSILGTMFFIDRSSSDTHSSRMLDTDQTGRYDGWKM